MRTLTNLLQDTDPVRHEAPPRDAERERIRHALLRATPSERPHAVVGARLAMVAALTMVILGTIGLGYLVWLRGATPLQAAVRFEMRLAEEQPVSGLVVAQLPDARRIVYVYPDVVVTNDDVAQTWVLEDGGRFDVAVRLLPAGAERMRRATTNHVGRPVAILIDGRVVSAPVVRSPISDSAIINGDYTRAEAERIAEGLSTR